VGRPVRKEPMARLLLDGHGDAIRRYGIGGVA
jgi:hypothetical protein